MVQHTCQFGGFPHDDPNEHISDFLEICDTQKINGVSSEVIKLKLFSFSLKDKAKTWFNSLPKNIIATWDKMATKFLTKYFPHLKRKNSKLISQPSPNLNLKASMKLGKGTKDKSGKSHITDFLLGWKSNFSTMD